MSDLEMRMLIGFVGGLVGGYLGSLIYIILSSRRK